METTILPVARLDAFVESIKDFIADQTGTSGADSSLWIAAMSDDVTESLSIKIPSEKRKPWRKGSKATRYCLITENLSAGCC